MAERTVALEFPKYNEHEFEQQDYIVEDLIVWGGTHLIYGREGVGKTQFVFSMMRSILNGERFLNRYRTEPCRIAYLSVDMPHFELQRRTRKLAKAGIERPNELLIVSNDGQIDLLETEESDRWLEAIWEFDPDLIFIDTLHKIHQLDENVSQTVTVVYRALEQILGSEKSIVLVHHEGKESPNPKHRRKDSDKARGSSAWVQNSDLGIYLEQEQTEEGKRIVVSFPRVRFCPEQPPIKTKTIPDTLTLEPVSEDKTARDCAREFLKQYPDADFSTVAEHLKTECGFSNKRSYDIAHEECE